MNPADDELYLRREQSQIKHVVLEKYLQRFAIIVSKRTDGILYVDGFSGPWNSVSDDFRDSSFAIALSQLRLARDTVRERFGKVLQIKCIFLERDPNAFAPQKLRVEINWPTLGKGAESQVLHYPVETDTVVALCERLIEMFGDEAVRWMTDRAITRYPISMHPLTTFKNPVRGNVYSHRAISGTPFYVCTHSSHPEKVRRLQSWVAGLPEPVNAAITIGVGRPTTAG
jgi:hypothetical protein